MSNLKLNSKSKLKQISLNQRIAFFTVAFIAVTGLYTLVFKADFYNPGGSNAAAIINVKDYGAKGDGVTDDTNAFKSAISASSTGTTLQVPTSTYKISSVLKLKSGIIIEGQNSTLYMPGPLSAIDLFDVNGTTGITINDIRLLSDKVAETTSSGVYGINGANSGVKDLTINNLKTENLSYGIKIGSGGPSYNVKINRWQAINDNQSIFFANLKSGSFRNLNLNSLTRSFYESGFKNHNIYLERGNENLLFENVRLSGGTGQSLHLYQQSGYPTYNGRNITFDGLVLDSVNRGIVVVGYDNTTIKNLIGVTNVASILEIDTSDNLIIDGFDVGGPYSTAIVVDSSPNGPVTNVTIKNGRYRQSNLISNSSIINGLTTSNNNKTSDQLVIPPYQIIEDPSISDTTPPSVPAGLTKGDVSTSSVSLTWQASTDNVAVSKYNIYRSSVLVGSSSSNTYVDNTVQASKTYNYNISAVDAAGNESARSTSLSVTTPTPPDTQAPSVPTGVSIGNVSQTSVELTWQASTDNVAVSKYNIYRDSILTQSVTGVKFVDVNLTAGKTYTYEISAVDNSDNESALSSKISVNTLPPADTQPPTAPSSLKTTEVSENSVSLSWDSSTDNFEVDIYKVYRDNVVIASVSTSSNGDTLISYTDNTVIPNWTYNYFITALDKAGNESTASNKIVVNTPSPPPPQDTQSPSVPTGLRAGIITQTSVALSWQASTDNVGVYGYKIFRNGILITFITNNSYQDVGVLPSTSYSYAVSAVDAVGNESAKSYSISVRTLDPVDNQAPSQPTNLRTTVVEYNKVGLSWGISTDNVAVEGYYVQRNGITLASVTSNSFTDNNVSPSVTYSYRVVAYDASGNSSVSESIAVNVPSAPIITDDKAPTAPGSLEIYRYRHGQVDLRWKASSDNVAVASYQIYRDDIGLLATIGSNNNSFGDGTVVKGQTYTYYVIAIDTSNNESVPSNTVGITIPDKNGGHRTKVYSFLRRH